MVESRTSLLTEVSDYYSEKLALHGETPRGVDWNGEVSQKLRFGELCRIIDDRDKFSLNDLGCGYGALFDFLHSRYSGCSYSGIDISEGMIEAAKIRYQGVENTRFILADTPDEVADYSLASGIFNVRLGSSDEQWLSYIESTLDILDRTSRVGFSFNCLTRYSEKGKMREYLYYADPCMLFDFCKQRYSKNVALFHDYDLYEFTIQVRKTL